ncbi:hypothetical protein BOX15_Mlig023739g1 [Macrostomum lignano]|uniref:Uncharacterized protein n=1 Tax=Macrostomum lignano TaxID=282301 RepID=A0A267FAS7_9PLAT|nr:hypothetical protein BOX15_Mlig023739g1 [Macrostomum lignano]
MNVCHAPLNNSFCHLVYNLRGRESLTLGCGSCDSIKFDKANQLCEKCNSTNCNFLKSNATFPPRFKLLLGKMGECYTFEGNEPTDWKAVNPVKIKCTGTSLDRWCSRAFYVDNGVKKLFIGCDSDCKVAIKGKIRLGRYNETETPRCGFCRLRGQEQYPVLPQPECLEPEPELIYGGGDPP